MWINGFFKRIKERFVPKRPEIIEGQFWYLKGYTNDAPWNLEEYQVRILAVSDGWVTFVTVKGPPNVRHCSTWRKDFFLASAKHDWEVRGIDW